MTDFVEVEKSTPEKKNNPFIYYLAIAWMFFFISLVLVLRITGIDSTVEAKNNHGFREVSGFDLRNTNPNSYVVLGNSLARFEESSLLYLDAMGQGQESYSIPLKDFNYSTSSSNLFVTSAESTQVLMFTPSAGTVIFDTDAPAENVRASESRLLLLKSTGESLGEIDVYDISKAKAELTLTFQESGYPLDFAFHSDGQGFDLSLLNVQDVGAKIILQSYSPTGEKLAEMSVLSSEVLPALHLISESCTAVFNNRTIMLFDIAEQKTLLEESFGEISDVALAPGQMAVLAKEEDNWQLKILAKSKGDYYFESSAVWSRSDITPLMANNEDTIFLAQENSLRAYDFNSGVLLAETELPFPAMNLLVFDNNNALVLGQTEAYFYTLD